MVEDRKFSAFQEKKATPYYSMLNYKLMESLFHTKEFGANFSHVCQSMHELRFDNYTRVSLITIGLHTNVV